VRAILVAGLAACSSGDDTDDIDDTDTPGTSDSGTAPTGPKVETTDNGDGTFTTIVAATSLEKWVVLSFANGELTDVDLATSTAWDLAFRREIVLLNSGASGPGTVDAAVLDGIAFESIRWPAIAGYAVDATGDADGNGLEDQVFATWFDYVYEEHHLYPADRRYVVRTPNGPVRMRFDTYYAAADGNSGHPTFTWAWLEEGGPLTGTSELFTVDATADWTRIALREWIATSPPNPLASDDWDVALLQGQVALNGGVSGPGGLTAASVALDFPAVATPPASGYVADAADANADGVPEYALAAAFVSDGAGGFTATSPLTFVVARPDGTYDKLGFPTWSTTGPATPSLQVAPLP
jgi:hypothetical protein